MCVVLLIFSSICTVVVGAAETVKGHRGQCLDIRCPYESGYESNSKYFCKGECNFRNKIIMVESGSPTKDKRFSLTDDRMARVFTVTITDLRTEDEGKYWCGVGRTLPLPDVYSEIMLLVKLDNKTTEVSTISPFTTTSSYFNTTEPNLQSTSITMAERKETITDQYSSSTGDVLHTGSVIYVSVGLVIVLIIFLMALMVLCRKRSKKSPRVAQSGHSQPVSVMLLPLNENTTEDIDCNNHNYQEISELQCKNKDITTIYTTADQPDDSIIYSTADRPDNSMIYSTAESLNDSMIYSTTDQPDVSTIYSTADRPDDAMIYSTAESHNDSMIYSTVD